MRTHRQRRFPASPNGYRAEVGDHEFRHVAAVAAGPVGRAVHVLVLEEHFLQDLGGLEGDAAALLRGRAPEDVDADFDEADVGFLVFGRGGAFAGAVVEEAQHDENGGGETDEVHGFAFVERLHFACSQRLVVAEDFAGPVEAGCAAVREAGIGLRLQHEGEVEVDSDLLVDHLGHQSLAELGGVGFDVGQERGVVEPFGIEFFP